MVRAIFRKNELALHTGRCRTDVVSDRKIGQDTGGLRVSRFVCDARIKTEKSKRIDGERILMTSVTTIPGSGIGQAITADEKEGVGGNPGWHHDRMVRFLITPKRRALCSGRCFSDRWSRITPLLAQIVSFATIGLSFLFRPLGAIFCGYMGDRFGRRVVFAFDADPDGDGDGPDRLATNLCPSGALAPALLILMRILQGFSAGGEWGGAALMSVEHAPVHRRSLLAHFLKSARHWA